MIQSVSCRIVPKIALAVFLSLLAWGASAQEYNEYKGQHWSKRIFTGGSFGFQFGNYATLVDVSPTIGYFLTNNLAVGTGFTYKYYKLKDLYIVRLPNGSVQRFDHVANILGTGLFARYYFSSEDFKLLNNLFAHTEYEFLNIRYTEYFPDNSLSDVIRKKRSVDVSSYFVGGGYRQIMGKRAHLYLLVLWNLNESIHSPYDNPVLRIGINFGL